MLQRHTGKSIIIGSVIIGISLIVALNLAQFTDWIRDATYHLSGQAAADKEAEERSNAGLRQQQLIAEQQRVTEAAKEKQERAAENARQIALVEAWQDFLTTNRKLFKQITIVQDTREGDYSCLRDKLPPDFSRSPLERLEAEHNDKARAEAARQAAEFWNYQVQDHIADGFLQWLNTNKVSAKSNWVYDDLKSLNQYDLGQLFNGRAMECLFPAEVWRANRYQKRIE